MKYLGIDYGAKRIGLAVSDDGGEFAFPFSILENGKNIVEKIKKICEEEKIQVIILGESLDYKGNPNPIMKHIEKFKNNLEKEISIPIHFEPEFLTSREAEHLQEDNKKLDASAAALILKSYLEKLNN